MIRCYYKANFTELHLLTNFEIMIPATDRVNFFFSHPRGTLKNKRKLKRFIISIFETEKQKLESINFIFTTDRAVLDINRKYLKHDYLTDVITFDLSETPGVKVAEIYISMDRVTENAMIQNTSFKDELHRVIFHGILHVCGYKDKTESQSLRIRRREDFYLSRYFD